MISIGGPSQNPQPNVPQPAQSNVQPLSHQPVAAASGVPNVGPQMHPVPQSVVPGGGIVGSGVVAAAAPQQQPSTNQQYNTASLCFLGQDTVQEIVTKVQEIFQILKILNPPTGIVAIANQSNDRRAKVQDSIRYLKSHFKRLRIIFEKCNDNNQLQGAEYMHIEGLIPIKEEWDMKTSEERKTSEAYRLASDECKELIDLVAVKNSQLKEVIDQLRKIVWEINTMLLMRKS